jgi:glycosyltransferase involved in cell wall biosynthesis
LVDLIVVDNFSSDDTQDIARRYADRVEVAGPERSAQRNYGAQLARGDYFLFIDSDMDLSATVVSECLEAAAEASLAGIVIPEVTVGKGFWAQCRVLERSCYLGDARVESARFIPRAIFHRVGGYDEALTGLEDKDLSIRLAEAGRLLRITAVITHDEGNVRLSEALVKKSYYAMTFGSFARKHGAAVSLGQANLVFRPAFIRNWRTLARHPLLTPGLFLFKLLELAAAVHGGIRGRLRYSPHFRSSPRGPA